jgi:hypothetical protein
MGDAQVPYGVGRADDVRTISGHQTFQPLLLFIAHEVLLKRPHALIIDFGSNRDSSVLSLPR